MGFSVIENNVLVRFDERDLDELGNYDIPDNVETVGEKAFAFCLNLQSVKIGKGVRLIEESAFANCNNLSKIDFVGETRTIKDKAFYACTGLESVVLPKGNMVLGAEVFSECSSLQSIKFSPFTARIGERCFYKCRNLNNVVIPKRVKTILNGTFAYCDNLDNIDFAGVTSFGERAFQATGFKSIVLPDAVKTVKDGCFMGSRPLLSISFPQGITRISKRVCSDCLSLCEVSLPDTVETIEENAFSTTDISNIVLPKGLKQIKEKAFYYSELNDIDLPVGVKFVGIQAFAKNQFMRKVSLPNDIDFLDKSAFNDSQIEEIEIKTDGETKNYKFNRFTGVNFEYGENLENQLNELLVVDNLLRIKMPYEFFEQLSKEQQDEFVYHSKAKAYNNMIKRLIMSGEGIYRRDNLKNLVGLMKLAYNLGIFSQDADISNKASVFLSDNIMKLCKTSELGKFFYDMKLMPYNREFANFFMQHTQELLAIERQQPSFLVRIHKDYDDIQAKHTSHKGKQRQLAPTVEFFKQYFDENKFQGVTLENRGIADELRKFYSKQETFDFALEIMKLYQETGKELIIDGPFKEARIDSVEQYRRKYLSLATDTVSKIGEVIDREFTYDWLKKDNPENLTMGKYCDCCSHLEGAGKYIVYASVIRPDMRNIVIRDKEGNIVAKSTMYVNVQKGYALCNNFEISRRGARGNKNAIVNAFLRGINDYAIYYNKVFSDNPIKQINVGRGFNDATQELLLVSKVNKPLNLQGVHFSQYNPQKENVYDGDWQHGQICVWTIDDNVEFLKQ